MQFLLFVECKAVRGQLLTMAELADRFGELMRVQGHEIFPEYQGFLIARGKAHAHSEYNAWFERTKRVPKEQKRLA